MSNYHPAQPLRNPRPKAHSTLSLPPFASNLQSMKDFEAKNTPDNQTAVSQQLWSESDPVATTSCPLQRDEPQAPRRKRRRTGIPLGLSAPESISRDEPPERVRIHTDCYTRGSDGFLAIRDHSTSSILAKDAQNEQTSSSVIRGNRLENDSAYVDLATRLGDINTSVTSVQKSCGSMVAAYRGTKDMTKKRRMVIVEGEEDTNGPVRLHNQRVTRRSSLPVSVEVRTRTSEIQKNPKKKTNSTTQARSSVDRRHRVRLPENSSKDSGEFESEIAAKEGKGISELLPKNSKLANSKARAKFKAERATARPQPANQGKLQKADSLILSHDLPMNTASKFTVELTNKKTRDEHVGFPLSTS
jgi:hypothetical protein